MATEKDNGSLNRQPNGKPEPDEQIKKFVNADSKEEVKDTADKIIGSDTDIDKDGLKEAKDQFRKEKKEDRLKQAENDAEFDQPTN